MPYDRQRFEVIAGDSFSRDVQWLDSTDAPQSFTNYDVSVTFRSRTDSSASLLTLTEGSGVTISGDEDETATFNVSPAQMLTMAEDAGGSLGEDVRVVFDMVLTIGSTFKLTILPGVLTIQGDAER